MGLGMAKGLRMEEQSMQQDKMEDRNRRKGWRQSRADRESVTRNEQTGTRLHVARSLELAW